MDKKTLYLQLLINSNLWTIRFCKKLSEYLLFGTCTASIEIFTNIRKIIVIGKNFGNSCVTQGRSSRLVYVTVFEKRMVLVHIYSYWKQINSYSSPGNIHIRFLLAEKSEDIFVGYCCKIYSNRPMHDWMPKPACRIVFTWCMNSW